MLNKYLILGIILVITFVIILVISLAMHKKRNLSHDALFVRKMLPCIDCGMCGSQNCSEFAKKIANSESEPDSCKLIRPDNLQKIKKYFKPTYNPSSKMVALVKCKGGCLAENKYIYDGARSCVVEEGLHSGSKACKYACLGCGDCKKACKYGAIKISKRGVAEIIRSKCTGCGACVKSCPNNLIEMTKLDLSVGVICNNKRVESNSQEKCKVSCIHCGKCIASCPNGAITMVDNIPVVDPEKCIECYKCVMACPNHVISRLL